MSYDIRFSEVQLDKLILHKVGSKAANEGVLAAKQAVELGDDNLREILLRYFLESFPKEEIHRFDHSSELSMNEVYMYCQYIFESPDEEFQQQSVQILQQLYEQSEHVKIKAGELYVAYFKDVIFEDELLDAIGIFKAENKDTYLKLKLNEQNQFVLDYEEGTSINKLDKGCLVLQTEAETGYRVLVVDAKGGDAKYWRDDFLQLTQIADDAVKTKDYIQLCKSFAKTVLEEEEDKQEQLHFVNKSMDYFQSKESFNSQEFKEDVFAENMDKAERFDEFKREYSEKKGVFRDEEDEQFFIAAPSVQKAKRSLRTSIQLDTELEIKVPSSKAESFLEKGFDEEKGMSYYKVYFNKEK